MTLMATGPGKYDDLATMVRETAKARGSVVIVFEGEHGSGFSVQADAYYTHSLPEVLRYMADQIEAEIG
jgi:hypothetical protein